MKAKSITATSANGLRSALESHISEDFRPTLAVVFSSVSQDRPALCKVFDDYGIAVYGVTTNGEFTDEGISEKSNAVLLLDVNRHYFRVYFSDFQSGSPRAATQEISREALKVFDNPAFLIAGSHMQTDAEELFHGFEDIIGRQVEVFGGMAGDDFSFTDQFVFTNDRESNQGVVVVALNADKIKIRGRATCGWKPMGTEKTVTRSEGNRVYTIDNVPVLEMTRKFSGLTNITEDNEKKVVLEIATTFPLQLQREKGSPVMRPGLVVNWEDGSFICSGTVPQGSKIRFSLPPDFEVLDEVIKGCEALKEEEIPEADAVIVYSCAGRILAFGPLMSKEIEGIEEVWKVPMAGMFSNAELARATDGNLEMHNLTTCCVVLKELD